jgi:hypothetical protein
MRFLHSLLTGFAPSGSAALLLSGCLASTLPSETNDHPVGDPPTLHGEGHGQAKATDSPEISRSVGVTGGVVVMWPRLIPKDDPELREMAQKLQKKLATLAHDTFPDAQVDIRPEPERVCPQSGCDAITVGLVLSKKESACTAAVLVSKRGPSPTGIVPWVGGVKTKAEPPFREPPESYITVTEWGSCAKVEDALIGGKPIGDDAPVVAALKSAMDASK